MLAEIAALMKVSTRGSDAVVRYGGDEFMILLADTTVAGAQNVVNRINGKLAEWNDANHLDGFRVKVSIGVAEWQDGATLDELLDRADQRMYENKHPNSAEVQLSPATS